MNIEEKKAFESVKDMFGDVTLKDIDEQSITIYGVAMLDVIKVLTIVEKQEKEIEHQKEKRENQKKELAILNAKQVEFNKLVNTVNSYKGQFKRQQKEIEELKKQDLSNSKIIANMSTRHFNDREKIRKYEKLIDKIKAKIEELDYNDIGNFERRCKQEVLQSLLEKGK